MRTGSKRSDEMAKLNYNSCRHSDGWPVTLKLADAVGEVLISGLVTIDDI